MNQSITIDVSTLVTTPLADGESLTINLVMDDVNSMDSIELTRNEVSSSFEITGVKMARHGTTCMNNPVPPSAFAVWLDGPGITLSNNDLTATYATSHSNLSSIGKSAGKWYWEYTTQLGQGEGGQLNGVATAASSRTNECGFSVGSYAFAAGGGAKFTAGTGLAYDGSYTTEVIGVLLDMDAGTVGFQVAGVDKGVAFSGLTGEHFASSGNSGTAVTANFGNTPFAFTVPAGYNAGLF